MLYNLLLKILSNEESTNLVFLMKINNHQMKMNK